MALDGFLTKYFGDPDLYEGTIIGKTMQGFPVIGEVPPSLRQQEYEDLPLVSTFHHKMFEMWKSEDAEHFDRVMEQVYNRRFYIKNRIDMPVTSLPDVAVGGHLKIWLEWVQISARADSLGIDPLLHMARAATPTAAQKGQTYDDD